MNPQGDQLYQRRLEQQGLNATGTRPPLEQPDPHSTNFQPPWLKAGTPQAVPPVVNPYTEAVKNWSPARGHHPPVTPTAATPPAIASTSAASQPHTPVNLSAHSDPFNDTQSQSTHVNAVAPSMGTVMPNAGRVVSASDFMHKATALSTPVGEAQPPVAIQASASPATGAYPPVHGQLHYQTDRAQPAAAPLQPAEELTKEVQALQEKLQERDRLLARALSESRMMESQLNQERALRRAEVTRAKRDTFAVFFHILKTEGADALQRDAERHLRELSANDGVVQNVGLGPEVALRSMPNVRTDADARAEFTGVLMRSREQLHRRGNQSEKSLI